MFLLTGRLLLCKKHQIAILNYRGTGISFAIQNLTDTVICEFQFFECTLNKSNAKWKALQIYRLMPLALREIVLLIFHERMNKAIESTRNRGEGGGRWLHIFRSYTMKTTNYADTDYGLWVAWRLCYSYLQSEYSKLEFCDFF